MPDWASVLRPRTWCYVYLKRASIWNLIYGTNEPFHRKEHHGLGEQTCGSQGGGEAVGWTGNLGLIDENHCFWNG